MADSKDKTSMPSAAAGNPMGLAMPWFQQVISAAFAFGLQYVNFEGIVTERIGVTIDADTCRYAIIASLALALGMLGALVNAARAQYNVAWPFMMLNQGDKNAVEYNKVQRAHGNFAEAALLIVPMTLVVAPLAPATILVLSQAWCVGKFLMSYSYATSDNTGARFAFAWSYGPYFCLHGYIWLGLAAKLGIYNAF